MAVLATGCLLYFFALGAWGCVYSYTPEVYPTDVRGSGTGWAACFGRIGAFVAPFIVPLVYASFGEGVGFTVVFIMLASAYCGGSGSNCAFRNGNEGEAQAIQSDEKVRARAMEMDEAADLKIQRIK